MSVVWYKVLPPQYGGQKAIAHLNEHLAQLVPLTMLCSRNNLPQAAGFPVLPLLPISKLQFLNPAVWRTIYRTAKQEGATHLVLEFPYYGVAGWWCKQLLGLRLVVNMHNVEAIRFKEQGRWWWRLLLWYESWVLRQADAVFFKTAKDQATAQQLFNLKEQKLSLVPYGVSKPRINNAIDVRQKHGIASNCSLLLFAGTLDYAPNAQAVTALYETVAPLLDQASLHYSILILGRNRHPKFAYLNRYHHPRIKMLSEVADSDLYFAAADAFISPVRSGGGVQTKLMDALSHGLTVVCFASKAGGIREAGEKLMAVPDGNWEAFAKAVAVACHTHASTPEAFYRTYDWRSIAATALQQLQSNA